MAEEDQDKVASIEETATWAVAVVCFVLIAVSILIEHAFSLLTKLLGKRRKSLNKALYKIKSELMLLGFISLLLTVSQGAISKICIPENVANTFLPCENSTLPYDIEEEPSCEHKGKVSLVSRDGVDQLQMLIFALALFHTVSCVLTFGLGVAKMRRWRYWEEETRTIEYQFSNDPRRFRLTHQTSFAKRHLKCWSSHPILRWPACFFRQFSGSVSKTDYFILRNGFIKAHFSEAHVFDFQKFLRRALDDDFQVVVGISLWVWIFSVFFIFFKAHGFYNYFWLPFIPLLILLLIGTKLQVVITKMCLETRNKSSVVIGTFLVKPHDNLFWFGRPRMLLYIMHFILFQNSFQLAFFTWTWYKFGFRSCFHKETEDIVLRMVTGLLVQFLCGYVTLPLYALVTQMGSSMNKAVFTERVIVGLKNWQTMAKRSITTSKTNSAARSPSYARDTTLSDGLEFESTQVDTSPDVGRQMKEEEKEVHQRTNGLKMYNGEVSFGLVG